MNKDKINKERKEKAKNIAFKILHGVSYALSTCFIATCIVACASSGAKNKSNNSPKSLIQYRIEGESESESQLESESVSYPIYDDEHYTIEFSYEEISEYEFYNLVDFLSSDEFDSNSSLLSNTSVDYDIYSFDFDDYVQADNLSYASNLDEIQINFHDFKFHRFVNSVEDDLSHNLIWNIDSTFYYSIKQAVQLDIIANQESPTSDIFTAISDSITNFVIALNSGITAIVGLFWNSTSSALTPLGVLTTIVVGVALAYFVFRLIIGLIRLRG